MTLGTLAVLINSTQQNWLPERWKARFDAVCGGRRVVLLPDASLDPAEVHYAAVWKPYLVSFMGSLGPVAAAR